MNPRNDGGPAFPDSLAQKPVHGTSGMSLRDYFAAAALPAVLTYSAQLKDSHQREKALQPQVVAHNAYGIADAMLETRQGKREQN